MTIARPRLSRRNLLAATVLGGPVAGCLGAASLFGVPPALAAASGRDFLQVVTSKAGCSYASGGSGPETFDCPGLIHWALAQLGISFPATSGEQIKACTVIDLNEAKKTPGALLWFPGAIAVSCGDGLTTFEARNENSLVGYFTTEPSGPKSWANGGLIPALSYAAPPSTVLTVDGYWGPSTTRRLQEVLKTTVDGQVSSQAVSWKAKNPGLTGGWEWVPDEQAVGSSVITALQQRLGIDADGLIGAGTILALEKHCGVAQEGHFGEASACIKELQKKLNSGVF